MAGRKRLSRFTGGSVHQTWWDRMACFASLSLTGRVRGTIQKLKKAY